MMIADFFELCLWTKISDVYRKLQKIAKNRKKICFFTKNIVILHAQMNFDIEIVFDTCERKKWLNAVIHYRAVIENRETISAVSIRLESNVTLQRFEPYHIVTLSCLIDVIKRKNSLVVLYVCNSNLHDFIWNDVRIKEYWNGHKIPTYSSPESKHFDLWRIDGQYIHNYSTSLFQYFRRVHFRNRDLGGLSNGLVELHQNVVDHAKANGIAFSYINYNEQLQKIEIAVCDFGVGIPYTLRLLYSDAKSALQACLKDGVSAKTNAHNFGLGLCDVASLVTKTDTLRIVSGEAMLYEENKIRKTYTMDMTFGGTLIYLTIDINSFYEEEIIEDFEL